jgi:adenylosuccinate lyase
LQGYQSPFEGRYASEEMKALFSPYQRVRTWRRLWVALAETEKELGLHITDQQIAELRAHIDDINFEDAAKKEREIRHDVMAHVYAYGLQCPKARGIIHLGATSCYVTDNADMILYREALGLIRDKLLKAIGNLAGFAKEHAALACLGYTHLQVAQPVTMGKRACLWIQDLMLDLHDLEYVTDSLKLLGSKGTTGTQASFLSLFGGDHQKCRALDAIIAEKMGFAATYAVTGQTYPRKEDSRILNVLSGVAQSAHRLGSDIRLLQHMRELEEPFEKNQVGSSAMAYKRNPMRSERICSIARYVIADALNPAMTASTQWLERTLDDSANRRIAIPEAFLAVDAILSLIINVTDGMVVYPAVIARRLREYLPFIATENLLMAGVQAGGDRQALHERIRVHSMEASRRMKEGDGVCDLIERLTSDPAFGATAEALEALMDPVLYIGRAPEQVREYLENEVEPALRVHPVGEVRAEINI